MSDVMKGIPFKTLLNRTLDEYRINHTVFQVSNLHQTSKDKTLSLFHRNLENPIGPAAGPHTQLAQNIIAAYAGGARFFELKTVQVLDGKEIALDKPCIRAEDECYNVEWSTELYINQAYEEYVKAWYICKLIAKEFMLGDPEAFQFNMSVGYDLKGIQSEKVDEFIEGLKDAKSTSIWKECETYTKDNLQLFSHIDEAYVNAIEPSICNSITLSTMHGCPAHEIKSIITYLLQEKKLNTYLKCNPTLLGYDLVRTTMDEMGYEYLSFDEHHFNDDLQFDDAIQLIREMQVLARSNNLQFGVKLSNTFPVMIKKKELPGEEMYMSGKSLYPLTIHLAYTLAKVFDGALPISFSGGADGTNIKEIFETGIWPITITTTLLKPTGYQKLKGFATTVEAMPYPTIQKIDLDKLEQLAKQSLQSKHYQKNETIKNSGLKAYAGNHNEDIHCKVVCGSCMHVCPNRANVVIKHAQGKLLLHIDDACNECGNCYFFCPDHCTPYQDRFTLFSSEASFHESKNQGFVLLQDQLLYRLAGKSETCSLKDAPAELISYIETIQKDYPYLLEQGQ